MRHLPLAALMFLVAALSAGPMAESDAFFRVKAGQEILARHGLPGHNLYSFTYPDHPDVDTAWLFEVGAAALHARGGFPALVLAKTAVLVGVFAAAFALARRRGAGSVAAALALGAAAFVARERFVERPHIFSLAGEVAVLAAVEAIAVAAASAGGARRALRVAALLVVAVALWANLHAGVFLAVVLLAAAAAGAALERRPRVAIWLAALAAACAAATLATPVGAGLYRYLALHTTLPALHPVDEFRALTWISDAPLIVYGVLAAVVVAGSAVSARAGRWAALLPVAALGLLALRSVRFGADFALAAAPSLAVALSLLAARVRGGALARLPAPLPALGAAALLVGLGAGARVAEARAAGAPVFSLGVDESAVPLDAVAFVEANGLRDRMYNDFEIGSYLLYEGYPRHRVFVDPRLPAYPPELHRLLGRADLTRAEWDAAMRGYGVDSALLAYAGLNRRVSWWDPAAWALVYRAHDARVFVRRLPRFRALIAAREIPATFSFTIEEGTATLPLDAPPATSPVSACEWQRRLGDLLFDLDGVAGPPPASAPSPRARAAYARALAAPAGCLGAPEEVRLASWLAAVELADGRAAGALELADRALARADAAGADSNDDDANTRAIRAIALEGLGRRAEAAAAWGEVAARAPAGSPLGARAREKQAALGR